MTTVKRLGFAVAMFCLLSTYPLAAQTAPSASSPRSGIPATSPRGATAPNAHREPCWKVAGVTQAAMQQRRQLEETTHSQTEAVCSDSGLTQQQKEQKIQQLRQQARQQAESLVSPAQQEALKSCREQRGEGMHAGGAHGGGLGPCGEAARGNKP